MTGYFVVAQQLLFGVDSLLNLLHNLEIAKVLYYSSVNWESMGNLWVTYEQSMVK